MKLKEILIKEYKDPLIDGILAGIYEISDGCGIKKNERHEAIDGFYDEKVEIRTSAFGALYRDCHYSSEIYPIAKAISGLGGFLTWIIPTVFVQGGIRYLKHKLSRKR